MKYLFVFMDSPYGSQRTYNGLRLAAAFAKSHGGPEVSIFLFGDGVVCGLARQNPADASYNVQEMLRLLAGQGVRVRACRTCMEARGIAPEALVEGAVRGTLDELTDLADDAEKVLVF